MVKKKTLILVGVILVALLGFVIFNMVGSTQQIYSQEEQQMVEGAMYKAQVQPLVKRTESTETICIDGICTMKLYAGKMFTLENGEWKTLAEVSSVEWVNGAFRFSYRNYYFDLIPFVVYNGQERSIAEIKQAFPDINIRDYIQPQKFGTKFALNYSNVPSNIVQNIDYFGFKLGESNGLTWDDIRKDGNGGIVIKEKVRVDYNDLRESGFTLNLVNKSYLLIGNISENYDNGVLWLDPQWILQDADTEVLGDSYLEELAVNDNNGASTSFQLAIDTSTGAVKTGLIMVDLTSLPEAESWDDAELCLFLDTNFLSDADGSFNISTNEIFKSYNISGAEWHEDTVTWANGPTESGVDFNATFSDTIHFQNDSGVDLFFCWNIFDIFERNVGSYNNMSIYLNMHDKIDTVSYAGDPLWFSTKEDSTPAERPYVNITYTCSGDCVNPTSTLNTPDGTEYLTAQIVTFNCSATDDVNVDNATLYWDVGGSWTSETTNDTDGDGDKILTGYVDTEGDYNWNCYVCDNSSNCVFADSNKTFSYHSYVLDIIYPTSSNQLETNASENETLRFLFTKDGTNQTTGVSINNITIENRQANIVEGGSELEVIENETFNSGTDLHIVDEMTNWHTYYAVDSGCVWWKDTDGTGSSSTGPCSGASNCATNDAGYDDNAYAYVETSSSNCNTGTGHAYMELANIDFDTYGDINFTFAYNMYGTNMGNLSLQTNETGDWVILWSEEGNLGTDWFITSVDMSGLTGIGNIRFDYDRNGQTSYYGDVAVDVINITNAGTGLEFGWLADSGWNVNVTIPALCNGTEDLFINATWGSYTRTETESNAVICGGGGEPPVGNCWTETAGMIAIPSGCKYYTSVTEGIAP